MGWFGLLSLRFFFGMGFELYDIKSWVNSGDLEKRTHQRIPYWIKPDTEILSLPWTQTQTAKKLITDMEFKFNWHSWTKNIVLFKIWSEINVIKTHLISRNVYMSKLHDIIRSAVYKKNQKQNNFYCNNKTLNKTCYKGSQVSFFTENF